MGSPERDLWQTVILQAMHDALRVEVNSKDDVMAQRSACSWFERGGKDFNLVCQLAGFDADFIRDAYLKKRIRPMDVAPKTARKRQAS